MAEPEKLEYNVSPLERNIGVIFPEGTKEAEKKLFAMQLETARLQGKDIEIDPALKFVPLKPKTEVNPPVTPTNVAPAPVPTPIPTSVQPQPVATPVPQPTVAPQPTPPVQPTTPTPPQPATEIKTETVVTANPINPAQTTTSTQTVQEQTKV